MTINFIVVIDVVTWWIFYVIIELVYAIRGAYGSQWDGICGPWWLLLSAVDDAAGVLLIFPPFFWCVEKKIGLRSPEFEPGFRMFVT